MCFFIQSCEPLGVKKENKNAHHSFVSLVSYLPPLPSPLHPSQLTHSWQQPTCMCWQPKSHCCFSSHLSCWDWGKVLLPAACHP